MISWLRAGYIPAHPLYKIPKRFFRIDPWEGFVEYIAGGRWADYIGYVALGFKIPRDVFTEMAVWGVAFGSPSAPRLTGTGWALWQWVDELMQLDNPRDVLKRTAEALAAARREVAKNLMEILRAVQPIYAIERRYKEAGGAAPYTSREAGLDTYIMVSVLVDSLPRLDLEARREAARFIWPEFLSDAREIAFKKLVALAFRPH